MSADVIARLKKLAGGAAETAAPATKAAPASAAKANPQWLQDMDSDEDEGTTEESIDNDDVEESDIPDASHRQAAPAAAPVLAATPTADDELANLIADRVVAKIRDALNHLVLD